MLNFLLFFICFGLATVAHAVDPVYSTKDFKGGIYTKSALVNGTAGAGYVELDHQSSNSGTPGTASNDVRIFAKSKKLYTATDDGAGNPIITEVGSGAAGGSINYITDKDAEGNSVGTWVTYADAAGLLPVDCDGGSPNTTFTVTSSSPLRGTYSYLAARCSGASRQGEGLAYAFTTALADASKMLTIGFSYKVASGTYAYGSGTAADPGDYVVYIYDVTNAVIIQPTNYMLNGSGEYVGQFQTDASSTSYKLCVHTAGTTNAAMTMKLDDISVGPKSIAKGPRITDYTAPTTEIVLKYGTTTATNITSYATKLRRVGDSLSFESKIVFSGAANADGIMYITLPNGLSFDTAKITGQYMRNWVVKLYTNAKIYTGIARYHTATQISIGMGANTGYDPLSWTGDTTAGDNLPSAAAIANNDYLSIDVQEAPILGWGSNTVVSSQDDGRSIEARAYGTTSTPSMTEETAYYIKFDTEEYDTHSAMSHAATGTTAITNGTTFYTPSAGYFHIDASIYLGSATAWVEGGDDYFVVQLYKNSVLHSEKTVNASMPVASYLMADIHTNIKLNANDTLQIAAYYKTASGTSNPHGMIASNSRNYFAVNKINSSETIAASEVVAARYKISAARNWDGTTPINFDTKTFDTHGAVTTGTWKFTAPISGYYSVSVQLQTEAITMTADNAFNVKLLKNGSTLVSALDAYEQDISGSAGGITITSVNRNVKGTDLVYLTAGEYIHIVGDRIAGSVPTLTSADGNYNWIAIHRIGGVM